MLRLHALNAFVDNYIWALVADDGRALVVDPGDARPVLDAARDGLRPVAVLLTHHHPDHVGGAQALQQAFGARCIAPDDARIEHADARVGDGDRVDVDELGTSFDVLGVPGHTLSHIAFHGAGRLFCGDTLFSLGCGRLFEGTPAQMLDSLERLAALPGDTDVCCGHEYTLANAQFALAVDPDNAALRARHAQAQALRADGRATLPSRLGDECAANPFLRSDAPAIRAALSARDGTPPPDRVAAFASLRAWKDGFRAA